MMIDQNIAEIISQKPIQPELYASDALHLFLDGQIYEQVVSYLYEDYILIQIQKSNHLEFLKINFNFELIFEFITAKDQNGTVQPFGFKFERFAKIILLKSKEPLCELVQWRQFLQTKINQRGFHELFKPIKKIGKGNFATVYLVHKHENGKRYAVKAFSKEGTYSEQKGKESLVNEIEMMRKVNNKNIMKLHGVYESQNSIYLMVQLLEGGQLYDKIKNRHKFTSIEIKMVLKGILEGLQAMHQNNIMHRDLKPENILLRKQNDYDCVIADLGLAEDCYSEEYLFVRCGTPGYVAPQIVNLKDLKAKYSPLCDLFSVGVIFHILALKKPPFNGKEYDQVLSQNRACNINFQAPDYLHLPNSWLDLMKRLLEKDPQRRISATEALNHDFFTKDQMFNQWTKERNSLRIDKQSMTNQGLSTQCQSPLMITKNNARKKGVLKQDSCLKFKMKENLLSGLTDQYGQTVDEIDSPGIKHRPTVRAGVESRFKRLAKQ